MNTPFYAGYLDHLPFGQIKAKPGKKKLPKKNQPIGMETILEGSDEEFDPFNDNILPTGSSPDPRPGKLKKMKKKKSLKVSGPEEPQSEKAKELDEVIKKKILLD